MIALPSLSTPQIPQIIPYINYLDSRTKDDVDLVNSWDLDIFGKETGNPEANCMFPAMFARWFLKNIEGFKKNGAKFIHDAPYVLAHLAGLSAKDMLMLLVRKKIRYNSYSHNIPLLLHSAFLHQIQDNTDSFFNSSILLLCTLGIFLSLILQKALKIHYEKHNTFSPNNKV